MSTFDTKRVVAFTTDDFDLSWPQGEDDPNVPPLGKDAAAFFRRKLSEFGVQVIGNEAVMGESGWHWNVSVGKDKFSLVIHWAPIGKPPKDFWVLQISKDVGLFAGLFGKTGSSDEVMPVVTVIKRIIEDEPRFNNVRWLTLEEFRSVY